jgi:hypothetical protein
MRVVAPELVIASGTTAKLEWSIDGGSIVRGLVTDQQNKPVANATIWMRWRRPGSSGSPAKIYFSSSDSALPGAIAKTDAAGRFDFAGVAPGEWWVGAAPSQLEATGNSDVCPQAIYVKVEPPPQETFVDLHVYRGLFIDGRVVNPSATPLAKAEILAKAASDNRLLVALSDEDGHFRIGPLAAEDFVVQARAIGEYLASEELRVTPDAHDVQLTLRRGGKIRCTVLDAHGKSTDASVVLRNQDRPAAAGYVGDTNQSICDFGGLESGSYYAFAMTRAGLCAMKSGIRVGLDEPAANVTLQLSQGGELRVRANPGRAQGPYSIIRDNLNIGGGMADGNGVSSHTVPAGRVQVMFGNSANGTSQRFVDIRAGEYVEITLD